MTFTESKEPDEDERKACQIATTIQERILHEMEKYWPQNFYTGYVASVCDIREKDLLFLMNDEKRTRAFNAFRTAVRRCNERHAERAAARAVPAGLPNAPNTAQQAASAQSAPKPRPVAAEGGAQHPAKPFHPLQRRKNEEEFKERLRKKREEQDKQDEDPAIKAQHELDEEVDRYLKIAENREADPLLWWRNNRALFPKIALLAREMLAVPASSAGAERVFKSLSLALSKQRRRLQDQHAENIVFIHENRQFFAPESWEVEQHQQKQEEKRAAEEAGDPDPSVDE
jgi:hypothetical protein